MTNLPVSPQEAAAELLRRRRARARLESFTTYTKPDYLVNWHHSVLCRYLDEFVRGKIKRMMVCMPPRHGKSELVSRRLPAYIFGQDPDANVIACSYNASLAADMNRDVQRIIDDEAYVKLFPETTLFGSNVRTVAQGTWLRNSDSFEIVGRKGVYRCAGIGGGITGRGFHYGIIDDPIKGRADADSEAYRNHVWKWYTADFFTRRANDDACILLTLTRWHQDDLAGRLLDQAAQNPKLPQWTIIKFPAVCEEPRSPDDVREIGQSLWPALFDEKALEETRDTSGPMDWSAVHQQRPSPAEGVVFKRGSFKYCRDCVEDDELVFALGVDEPGRPAARWKAKECRWFQCCDTALTVTKNAAFTAVGTFVMTPAHDLLVYHVWREKLQVPEQFNGLMELRDGMAVFNARSRKWDSHGHANPWPQPLMFQAVEAMASGVGLIQQAAASGRPLRALRADSDKVVRAATVSAMYENGKVYHRAGQPWLSRFEDELLSFPSGTYKDQADILAYAGIAVTQDTLLNAGVNGPLLVGYGDYGEPDSWREPKQPEQPQPAGVYDVDQIFDNAERDVWTP